MAKTYQIAAIPIRRTELGAVEVLLVTSRGTQRWVVPKGWPWPNRSDWDAAAGEAWEEAGVRGETSAMSIGSFAYTKRANGSGRELSVHAYVLRVLEEAADWPEATQRRRSWFSPQMAAELVAEPDLKLLLRALDAD